MTEFTISNIPEPTFYTPPNLSFLLYISKTDSLLTLFLTSIHSDMQTYDDDEYEQMVYCRQCGHGWAYDDNDSCPNGCDDY